MFWKKGFTKEFEAEWEKKRKMNKWLYFFIYGSLLWGLPVSILVIGWVDIKNKGLSIEDIKETKFIVQSVVQVVLFLAVGLYIGYQDWKNSENMYQKLKSGKKDGK